MIEKPFLMSMPTRTQFENQVVVDVEDPSKIRFYNLEGESTQIVFSLI